MARDSRSIGDRLKYELRLGHGTMPGAEYGRV